MMRNRYCWSWDDSYSSVIDRPREAEIYTGSKRDDVLVGTFGDDQFYPGTGVDRVDGRAGHDSLFVDYSGLTATAIATITYDSATGYGGEFRAIRDPASAVPTTVSDVRFKGIEDVHFLSTSGGRTNSASVAVAVAPRGTDTKLDLDAGDTRNADIQIDMRAIAGLSLAMAADGSIVDEAGSFRHFSFYQILFGGGANTYHGGNVETNVLFSNITSSADGGGFDKTYVDYAIDTAEDISLYISGQTGYFLDGARFTNVKSVSLYGGDGINRLFTDSFGNIAGLKGRNELYVDLSSYGKGIDLDLIHYSKSKYFSADFHPIDNSGGVSIHGSFVFSNGLVNATLSANNDRVSYNFVKGDVIIDGGPGTDILYISPDSGGVPNPDIERTSVDFIVNHDRATISYGATFVNFESVDIVGSRSNDLLSGINKGVSSNLIDHINGGVGIDTMTYHYTDSGVTVSLATSGI